MCSKSDADLEAMFNTGNIEEMSSVIWHLFDRGLITKYIKVQDTHTNENRQRERERRTERERHTHTRSSI